MKILDNKNNISAFENKIISDSQKGRWYCAHRVYILKKTQGYTAISLHIFERMMASLYHLFSKNYFSKILNDKHVTIVNLNSLSSESKKTSEVAKKPATIPHSPKDVDEWERKNGELEAKQFAAAIADVLATEALYTHLKTPEKEIRLNELIEASSFVLKYIQTHAQGHSIDLTVDTFSNHVHLCHFDTIIAATRRLIFGNQIEGYEVDSTQQILHVALNNQSELVRKDNFVNKEALEKVIVKPIIKSFFTK